LIDPARCVDGNGNVACTTYNDFSHLKWIGAKSGKTPVFSTGNAGRWFCIEHHVKLNDPGQSNGVQEFWIDGNLEARDENLNFIGSYTTYGINAIFIENYWNEGSLKKQERYIDNIVVSTKPIGCFPTKAIPKLNKSGRGIHLNYSDGNMEIHLTSFEKEPIQSVEAYSAMGALMYKYIPPNYCNTLSFSLPHARSGIYFLAVKPQQPIHFKILAGL
jgi:hypothetical protein